MMNYIQNNPLLVLLMMIMGIGIKVEAQTMILDSANVVIGYHYSCNTKDAKSNPVIEEYDIVLLIGKSIVAQQGYCESFFNEDNDDEYLQMLIERQHNIPKIYIGFPKEDKITIHESILMNDFEMIEEKEHTEWQIFSDTLIMNGYNCKKATANVGGRQWVAFFSEAIPIPYGPWFLRGLPGLIVYAESDDIHKYSMVSLSVTSCPIKYEKRVDIIKTSRKQYLKYRDKITKHPAYLTNPSSLIAPEILRHKDIYQFSNGYEFIEMNGHIFNPHPRVFVPLDLK